jgi:hypothetical protein
MIKIKVLYDWNAFHKDSVMFFIPYKINKEDDYVVNIFCGFSALKEQSMFVNMDDVTPIRNFKSINGIELSTPETVHHFVKYLFNKDLIVT